MDADAVEVRVLGCLVEKQRTTPDAYPLSLNSLRLACNQTTNRDPVVAYAEPEIRGALERLSRRGWVRLASGAGSRAAKYRHLLDDALGVSSAGLALLALLMLRGPQTLGELRQRSERLHTFTSSDKLESELEALMGSSLVAQLSRRPGQKEQRYAHLLGGDVSGEGSSERASGDGHAGSQDERIAAVERRLGRLEEELATLRAMLEESEGWDARSGLRDPGLERSR
jgi:hypothetical protein